MRPLRILIHAVALKRRGGSSRHLEEFLSALKRVGQEHEYIVCFDERFAQQYQGPLPPGKVVFVRIHSDLHRLWWDEIELPRLVRRERCNVILALLTFGSTRLAVPQILFMRTPTYFCNHYLKTLHGKQRWVTLLRRWWLKLVMQASRIIITPTAAMRDAILKVYPDLPKERFRVIPHGFDKKRFLRIIRKRTQEAQGEQQASSALRILYVSNLLPYKGFDLIPYVARCLIDQGIAHRFIFTGERDDWPEGYDQMMEKAKTLGVEHCLHPLGRLPLEEVYRLYISADIFFFPSWCESFGFPLIEAMGAGLPIVAADTPVNREICGRAAVYFQPGNAASAAQQIAKLCDLRERSELRRRGEECFANRVIDMDEYVRKVWCEIEACLKGS